MHSHVWTICDCRIKTHARKDSRGRVSAEEEVKCLYNYVTNKQDFEDNVRRLII